MTLSVDSKLSVDSVETCTGPSAVILGQGSTRHVADTCDEEYVDVTILSLVLHQVEDRFEILVGSLKNLWLCWLPHKMLYKLASSITGYRELDS